MIKENLLHLYSVVQVIYDSDDPPVVLFATARGWKVRFGNGLLAAETRFRPRGCRRGWRSSLWSVPDAIFLPVAAIL